VGVVLSVTLGLPVGLGRPWALGLIGVLLQGVAYIHLVWLPLERGERLDAGAEGAVSRVDRTGAAPA
jgi:hypothetical protein